MSISSLARTDSGDGDGFCGDDDDVGEPFLIFCFFLAGSGGSPS